MASSLPTFFPPRDKSDNPDPDQIHPPHHAGNPQRLHFATVSKTFSPAIATDKPLRLRERANTNFARPGLGNALHRRTIHQRAPTRLDLAPTTEEVADSETYPLIATVAYFSPSAPIPIPGRPNPPSRPTTPLTGRAAKGAYFPFPNHTPPTSRFGKSSDSQHQPLSPASVSSLKTTSPTRSSSPSMSPSTMPREQSSHRIQPSSPLSPTMPLSPLLPLTQYGRKPGRGGQHLQIPVLPRFHPANFQSFDRTELDSSQRNRSNTSRRPFSDAQHKLHRYQRDLITSVTRPSRPPALQGLTDPPPPRLHPLGSPGPVTPLALEEKKDYMAAGAAASSYGLGDSGGAELVEKFIRQEQERINYSGMQSDRHSPAVSPAGGRG